MIKQHQLQTWLDSPVTQRLFDKLAEHKTAHLEVMNSLVLNLPEADFFNKTLEMKLLRLRGYIELLEQIIDIREFLEIEEVLVDEEQKVDSVKE